MMVVNCPYCQAEAELTTGKEIYPHRKDLYDLKFWICRPCGAYTGTHKQSKEHAPKGKLADEALRKTRMRAHRMFDPLWESGYMTRNNAYAWLQEKLGWDKKPHIGFMDIEECERVVELCRPDR